MSVRFNPDGYARLRAIAEARGVNLSRALRQLVDGAAPDAPPQARPHLSKKRLLDLLRERAEDGNVSAIRTLLDIERQADPRAGAMAALEQMAKGRQS
jgi:hypothetical protein